jgi:hypothetical protein
MRIARHIEVQDLTPIVADNEKAVQNTEPERWEVKKSIAAMASPWFLRNVSHRFAGSGYLGARRIHRETLLSETSKPSLSSSP